MARQSHGGDTPLPSLDLIGRHYGTTKRSNSRRLEPQPLLDAATIANARSTIGNVEKNELSDEQISAIVGAAHNTLVLAGAGTGKTTTIVGYIAWLLNTGKAQPNEILVLSFTRKSADEMSARIQAQTGAAIRACTFHSLGLEIHEAPNCNQRNTEPMPLHAVCSAEPGIYLPGKFGVRIEDVTVLTKDGCEILTKSPKNLIIL